MGKRVIKEGKIQGNQRGFAFLIVEGEKEDYFIPHHELKGALHEDTVLCETFNEGEGKRTLARVLKILKRGKDKVCGTYFTKRNGGIVIPDEDKFSVNVFIPFCKGVRAKSGDKVVAKILSYPKKQNPEGMVVKVLGRQFEKQAELKSIIYSYNLPENFPKSVLDYANLQLKHITKDDIINRRDLINEVIFTIDGEDAKDFDDAVSIEKKDGCYYLGVHIADVSHYVKKDSPIDKEAFYRGTSTYFPESVIPMLPEKLCNDLCSLKEGVERLTLSVLIKLNENGKVIDREITPSVIKSKARLTYTEVQAVLDGDEKVIKRRKNIYEKILLMNELATILTTKREVNGSIDLDVNESQILVDERGKITVKSAEKNQAHNLIEQFMILANCIVAEYIYYAELPFIYRVHTNPSEEKLNKFYAFLDGLGVKYKRNKNGIYPIDFQRILKQVENSPNFTLINRVMLRSMQKAEYSPNCLGHFGLSEKHYCHFTSPIRRYPDLVVHRILKDFLSGEINLEEKYSNFVEVASKQSSEREKISTEAERAVDDYYKMLYISEKEGEEFFGVISGVANFGLFVELENGIEGLVKIETLKGKKYIYNEEKYTLSNNKTTYRLGQKVKIVVSSVDTFSKRAEFMLIEEEKKNEETEK
ncbi:MAG: ribonuclease R [Clostridia bacterium]|nr:ribonuclease R [Clostridia bacterium]